MDNRADIQELSADHDFSLASAARRVSRALRRNVLLFAAAVAVVVGLGAGSLSMTAPTYTAKAAIIIDPRRATELDDTRAMPVANDALLVDSEIELLTSEAVLGRVVREVGILDMVRQAAEEAGRSPSDTELMSEALAHVRSNLTVARQGVTYVIHIFFVSPDPDMAARVTNTIANQYIAYQLDSQLTNTGQLSDWLNTQLASMNADLIAAEEAVEAFKYANELDSEEILSFEEKELAEVTDSIIDVRGRIREAQGVIAQVDMILDGTSSAEEIAVMSLDTRLSSNLLLQLQTTYLGQTEELQDALGRLGPSHVEVIGLERARNATAAEIVQEFSRIKAGRLTMIEASRRELDDLQEDVTRLRADISDLGRRKIELRELERNADTLRAQYESFLQRFEQNQREGQYFRSSAQVIEEALPPVAPSAPRKTRVMTFALLGGLILGSGLTFLREQLDATVRGPDDITETLGVRYLGSLPHLTRSDRSALPAQLHTSTASGTKLRRDRRKTLLILSSAGRAPLSNIAESLRRLTYELDLRQIEAGEGRVVGVVSAVNGEGKTTLAGNLAFFLAAHDKKVALIDTDFRNPVLSDTLNPIVRGPSLFQALQAPQLAAESEPVAGLTFLGMRDAAEIRRLIGAVNSSPQSMKALVNYLRGHFDAVVIDTAPMAYVVDGLVPMALVDDLLLSVRWNRTSVSVVRRALSNNAAIQAKLRGAVLSGATTKRIAEYEQIPNSPAYFHRRERRIG